MPRYMVRVTGTLTNPEREPEAVYSEIHNVDAETPELAAAQVIEDLRTKTLEDTEGDWWEVETDDCACGWSYSSLVINPVVSVTVPVTVPATWDLTLREGE